MRTTQFVGLSAEAVIYLESFGQEHKLRILLEVSESGDSKIIYSQKIRKNLVIEQLSERITEGMFGEEIPLRDFLFPDNTVLEERVQLADWSSGPVIATGLYKQNGELVVGWSEEDYQELL